MPLGCRPLLALVVLPVLALVAGFVTLGAHAQTTAAKAPQASANALAATGCTQHNLKYGVTDDPRVVQQQMTFESSLNAITDPGFYTHAQPYTPTLHAASHGNVVVFYRPDALTREVRASLEALNAAAVATKAPVIIAPRAEQPQALVALGLGAELACPTATATQAAQVRAFAAGVYPSLKA
jgi:hypothetical protein